MHEKGVISRTVIPAYAKEVGKERGEWIKLTDAEYRLILRFRAEQARQSR